MLLKYIPAVAVAGLALMSAADAGVPGQHAQVSAVAIPAGSTQQVWVCNRDNNSVALVDVALGSVIAEIDTGINPRSCSLSADGSLLFVANQRGNIPSRANAVTGFPANAEPGSLTVIDTQSRSVLTTINGVGVEPYGVRVSPNGKYFAVSGFRSGTIKLYHATTFVELASFQYLNNLSFIPNPFTIADADANRDGIADTGEPRGFTIRGDSTKIYVTHNRSPYISVLDVTLDGAGLPTAIGLTALISMQNYAVDPFFNPTPVQILKSQGLPRFMEDIALSPDGTRALVPHLLHNINHDVNHDFGPGLAGDFANRVYPALTVIDSATNTFNSPGDNSGQLHHELADPLEPASYAAFGEAHIMTTSGNPLVLGGSGNPVLGGTIDIQVEGIQPGDTAVAWVGVVERNDFLGSPGYRYVRPRVVLPMTGGAVSINVPNLGSYDGTILIAQAQVTDGVTAEVGTSNAVRIRLSSTSYGPNQLGYRAGHPTRVLYNEAGTSAVMLNRGSEDLFLFDVSGSDLTLRTVFPERIQFTERAPLTRSTPLGDLPLGMAMVPDPTTDNDDALLYVINEGNRSVSSLRVDFAAGTVIQRFPQVKSFIGSDEFRLSERIGQELFEDASRAQTAGNFNNSCASCHFEGGEDGNVWQRGAGPRSTIAIYGGHLATGLVLWKGVRLNLGETGPMFGGENGGHGILTDAEQQGLVDYHEKVSPPLNPNRTAGMGLDAVAAFGRDLFFGKDDTGLNPTLRTANCFECHDNIETEPLSHPGPRFFTVDFVNPLLSAGDCFSLRESVAVLGVRNVNTGANVDLDNDLVIDIDRNGDGFDDRESYAIMNVDTQDDFRRDDGNSYLCPCDPIFDPTCDPQNPFRLFTRTASGFSIPTKLGVYSTGPYFHDHSVYSLRNLVDPESQMFDPVYGDLAYGAVTPRPTVFKIYNEAHDVRGHEMPPSAPGNSKVQQTLNSIDPDADTERILRYIQSL
jgi:YVTN family beta-propeller protein